MVDADLRDGCAGGTASVGCSLSRGPRGDDWGGTGKGDYYGNGGKRDVHGDARIVRDRLSTGVSRRYFRGRGVGIQHFVGWIFHSDMGALGRGVCAWRLGCGKVERPTADGWPSCSYGPSDNDDLP